MHFICSDGFLINGLYAHIFSIGAVFCIMESKTIFNIRGARTVHAATKRKKEESEKKHTHNWNHLGKSKQTAKERSIRKNQTDKSMGELSKWEVNMHRTDSARTKIDDDTNDNRALYGEQLITFDWKCDEDSRMNFHFVALCCVLRCFFIHLRKIISCFFFLFSSLLHSFCETCCDYARACLGDAPRNFCLTQAINFVIASLDDLERNS